jgi:molybdopterin-containing oxidoreductase family iron-sulfur binding subunit
MGCAPAAPSGTTAVSKRSKSPAITCSRLHRITTRSIRGGIPFTRNLEEFKKDPESVHDGAENPPRELTMYPEWKYPGHAWGMTIDLNACNGCSACVVACQAENNIAVVGKDQVRRGRVMQWLRVDSYYHGEIEDPEHLQSAGAVHAVRECAVRAGVPGASHHPQRRRPERHGLQPLRGHALLREQLPVQGAAVQLLLFSDFDNSEPQAAAQSRRIGAQPGVMEKCTYCVQRINAAKIDSERENRPLRDGEIQTACEASCPTQAIVFGDINDKQSRVSKLKAERAKLRAAGGLNTGRAPRISRSCAIPTRSLRARWPTNWKSRSAAAVQGDHRPELYLRHGHRSDRERGAHQENAEVLVRRPAVGLCC